MATTINLFDEDKPQLDPEFLRRLAQSGPCYCAPSDVQAWFDRKWPVMAERYTRKGLKQAVTNWWSRAKPEEIKEAREAARLRREGAEVARLEQLQAELNRPDPKGEVIDFFARTGRRA